MPFHHPRKSVFRQADSNRALVRVAKAGVFVGLCVLTFCVPDGVRIFRPVNLLAAASESGPQPIPSQYNFPPPLFLHLLGERRCRIHQAFLNMQRAAKSSR
jgi:hypothetical protein